jgi:hypothetical protein
MDCGPRSGDRQVARPSTLMLVVVGLVAFLSLGVPISSGAAETDLSTAPIETLIDDLTLIDAPAPGIDGAAWFSAFMADNWVPRFEGGILGSATPRIPPQMRELVRRGLRALPSLVEHLDDGRPTRLSVGMDSIFMWGYLSDEYDPRYRPAPRKLCNPSCMKKDLEASPDADSPFKRTYVVRVGDICYVLVGQIVNRDLVAVRYQPSGGIIINSPLEAPGLIERVKADWVDLDAPAHEASLLADICAADQVWQIGPAFARLRFYYPAVYAGLRDDDLRKREAFEADEKAHATQE